MQEAKVELDLRSIAIYSRKSAVTHKGDSIANQKENCLNFVKCSGRCSDKDSIIYYEDLGISGATTARPQFNQMLKDVKDNKIKIVVAYKLDRISRQLADLAELMNFLKKYNCLLLISSDNICSDSAASEMMMLLLGVFAEFERNILKERIIDNLNEYAKNGQWLGGRTPLGYDSEKREVGIGKKRTTVCYLRQNLEEAEIVKFIFDTFIKTRNYKETARVVSKKYKTQKGNEFNARAIQDIIRNPVYCIGDKAIYEYFLAKGGNLYGDIDDYNGKYGIAVYNRTKQELIDDDDSTILEGKRTRKMTFNDESDWIITIGKHNGIIESDKWIQAQTIKEEIADKYNRPHTATNALLSGIIYCPKCNSRLYPRSQSNRYTNGRKRFTYSCTTHERSVKNNTEECDYNSLNGIFLDDYIIEKLSDYFNKNKESYIGKLKKHIKDAIHNDEFEQHIKELQNEINKIEKDIASQVKNLRDAQEEIKAYIFDDINRMKIEQDKLNEELTVLLGKRQDVTLLEKDFDNIMKKISSYEEFLKDSTPEEKVTFIHSIVERIYVYGEDENRKCHIFFRGSTTEEYSDFFENELCDSNDNRQLHSYICRSAIKKRV